MDLIHHGKRMLRVLPERWQVMEWSCVASLYRNPTLRHALDEEGAEASVDLEWLYVMNVIPTYRHRSLIPPCHTINNANKITPSLISLIQILEAVSGDEGYDLLHPIVEPYFFRAEVFGVVDE